MPSRETHIHRLISSAAFAAKVYHGKLPMPSRESHIRPLLERLDREDERLAVWRDILAVGG